ncbi:MAG: chromosome segregation protein SMC [Zetaproteobacteria bacterium CG1_02_53_45]|nr:MAG: chromosome segregation protein SMC [Zetaproteobacteria bacterium CG1_02_53_45]
MRLKRIELAGFKSFVDPTRIELDKGITAIVGPNGCGKSNIIDALRWVLGEHSAKHLRGGVMEDLIFQGSDSRPPVAICDVELTFSVERGSLASPYHELEEIRVRRRLMREGGSDAFINGKIVRLKDVVDLFLDTGISTRAYAIVEQGSIARMVTAKPEERRVIFEEAAGVMKYRSRRKEAERRMKDTRQNLDRVLDLLEEVRSQCRSLRQQAGRAERFRTMQNEFSHLQAVSLGLRYQSLQHGYRELELKLVESRVAESEAARQLTAAEHVVALAREQVVSHEMDVQTVQDQLREAERRCAQLQQQAERESGERRLLTERKTALNYRLEEAGLLQQRINAESAGAEQRLAEQDDAALQQMRDEATQALAAAQLFSQQQGLKRDTLLSEFERLRHSSEQVREQKEKSEAALVRLQERELKLAGQLHECASLHESNSQARLQAEAALEHGEQRYRQAGLELTVAQEKLDLCREMRESAVRALSESESEVRELKGSVQELRGRIKNQDVPDALRDDLRARGAVWIDEALHVPEGLEAAVAAVLRGRSADACMPADAGISSWRQVMTEVADAPVALFAGATKGASAGGQSLAEVLELKPDHLLYELFAPVSLVDDISEAFDQTGYAVSRDGWRFEPQGWLVPPSGNRTARRLATQRLLRQSEARLLTSQARLDDASAQFRQTETELEAQQKSWQQAHLAVTRTESEWHAVRATVTRLQAEADSLLERQQRLTIDLQEAAEEKAHWQYQLEQAASVDQAELALAQQQLAEQDISVSRATQSLNQARTAQAQADQSLALFAQARDHLLRESARLKQESLRLNEQIAADAIRLQKVEVELESATRLSDLDQQLSQAAENVEAMHRAMNEVRQQGHELQQAQHEAERTERQTRQLLQQTSDKRQSVELIEAQDAIRLQDLAGEIEQRCQATADELLERIDAMADIGEIESIKRRALDLEEKLSRFGPVNLLAIEEFEQASERELFLAGQATDLEASLTTLGDTIARIDRTTRQRFRDVFDKTNAIFQKTFPQLFGGGRAELRLDSDDILTAGVEVIAQPPGKRLQDVTLLSGGEKALTAVALVFSIFQIKPAPFCVLDEVDAPLDDANVGRFGEMVRELADRVQFLSISHNKITMQQADRLIGVSMPEPGVSKIVAVDMGAVPE